MSEQQDFVRATQRSWSEVLDYTEDCQRRFSVSPNLRWWLMGILVGLLLLGVFMVMAERDLAGAAEERAQHQLREQLLKQRLQCTDYGGNGGPLLVACVGTIYVL